MAEVEVDSRPPQSRDEEAEVKNVDDNKNEDKKNRRRRRKASCWPRFGCFKMEADDGGGVDSAVDFAGERRNPTHLVIMVNGIMGSAQNWKFAARQFLKEYPDDLIVHRSESNCQMLTLHGIDVMGERLANEASLLGAPNTLAMTKVVSVIKRHPSVLKISFICHSLGGLIGRYAIARLYQPDVTRELSQGNGASRSDHEGYSSPEGKFGGKIAGLEPMNFITSATPHLGSWGHKQVPIFCGFYTLEKGATHTSWFLGRTGKHLFLTDRDKGQHPLLLQMVRDCEDLKFISALRAFRHRVAYANARFDHILFL
ncbi:hypothetical protein SLEP1_g30181 [Rubroshorea leprosula]|uniref:DUF676 domain-containing protein n=1 Tax=Rubroshorea leprosula TaxID=152421 RepID=A0AAV5K756_9ROSI|nr:hypothetical protein SLEP1_g30181 [Rubroshorea leprosula]